MRAEFGAMMNARVLEHVPLSGAARVFCSFFSVTSGELFPSLMPLIARADCLF